MREASSNFSGLSYLGLSLNNKSYKIRGIFFVQTRIKILYIFVVVWIVYYE